MRIIELHEREVRAFPRSDLVDQRGRSLILPETRALSAVEVKDAGDEVQLRVLGLIGYLPLTSEITLNLRPKFSTDSLWYMLEMANENYNRVLPLVRTYQRADEAAPHFLLARAFCYYLGELLSAGVWRGYSRERQEGYFRPKVAFGETASRFLARGDLISTVSDTFLFSAKSDANQFLKAACLRFASLVPRTMDWAVERDILSTAIATLASVSTSRMCPGDHLLAVGRVPMRAREPYLGALSVYGILLGHLNVGFAYDAVGSDMPSFLFCLDDVFEAFVRNICRAGLREAGLSVLDGNRPKNQQSLFLDNRRFPTKPDLLIRDVGRVIAIGEVKYKPRIEESDRYQLISHVMASGAPLGLWISPSLSAEESGLDYVGSLRGGIEFYHYRLFVGADMPTFCKQMVDSITGLLLSKPDTYVTGLAVA